MTVRSDSSDIRQARVILTSWTPSSPRWISKGVDGFEIAECDKESYGTDVILTIRDGEDYDKYLEEYEIRRLIKKYSDYISFPIKMEVESAVNTAKEGEEAK